MEELTVYRNVVSARDVPYLTNLHYSLERIAREAEISRGDLDRLVRYYDSLRREAFTSVYNVEHLGDTYEEDGTSRTSRSLLIFALAPHSPLVAQLLADYLFPITRCLHSYDCCGHWYQYSWPTVEQRDAHSFVITRQIHQNV